MSNLQPEIPFSTKQACYRTQVRKMERIKRKACDCVGSKATAQMIVFTCTDEIKECRAIHPNSLKTSQANEPTSANTLAQRTEREASVLFTVRLRERHSCPAELKMMERHIAREVISATRGSSRLFKEFEKMIKLTELEYHTVAQKVQRERSGVTKS